MNKSDWEPLPEHSMVRLLVPIGQTNAGAFGTIVHVYPTGAYLVEFEFDGYHTVETCELDQVEPANV